MSQERRLKADIYEKAVILKLLHNKELQKQYLPEVLPYLWSQPEDRVFVYIMKYLKDHSIPITINNLQVALTIKEVKLFMNRMEAVVDGMDLASYWHDDTIKPSADLFQEAYEELHDIAFSRYVEKTKEDFTFDLGYNKRHYIIARAKSIIKLHEVIYRHKFIKPTNDIDTAVDFINTRDELIPTFSPKLNGLMGGWTRGFANTVLGRAGHTKSTMMTFDSVHKAVYEVVDGVHAILIEEQPPVFWRRVIAILLKIPIREMRSKTVKISETQKAAVKRKLGGRLKVHTVTTFKDLIDLISTIKDEFLWIDHINAVQYPGRGNALQNMMGGILGLINAQVGFLRDRPYQSHINLSQVNEKELIRRTGRDIWKHPSYHDAYGSQILHQHSREYITLYYPRRDVLNNPDAWAGKKELKDAEPEDVYLKVEKSSFGDLSRMKFNYNFDFATFKDVDERASNVTIKASDKTDSLFEDEGIL